MKKPTLTLLLGSLLAACSAAEPAPQPSAPPAPPAVTIDPNAPSSLATSPEQEFFANCPQGFGDQPAECGVAP